MKLALIILIILLFILIGSGFYYFYFQLIPMKNQVAELTAENAELKQKIEFLSKVKQEKEKQIESVTETYRELISDMQAEVTRGEIKISELAGKLKVNIVDKILFDSGESTISRKGKLLLERVGNILKQDTTKIIRVEGHTDNVKIHRKLKRKFSTNWELSSSRAINVVRFLQERLRIKGHRLEAAGYAEYQPVASNKTAQGRAENRRIEIVLVPK